MPTYLPINFRETAERVGGIRSPTIPGLLLLHRSNGTGLALNDLQAKMVEAGCLLGCRRTPEVDSKAVHAALTNHEILLADLEAAEPDISFAFFYLRKTDL